MTKEQFTAVCNKFTGKDPADALNDVLTFRADNYPVIEAEAIRKSGGMLWYEDGSTCGIVIYDTLGADMHVTERSGWTFIDIGVVFGVTFKDLDDTYNPETTDISAFDYKAKLLNLTDVVTRHPKFEKSEYRFSVGSTVDSDDIKVLLPVDLTSSDYVINRYLTEDDANESEADALGSSSKKQASATIDTSKAGTQYLRIVMNKEGTKGSAIAAIIIE